VIADLLYSCVFVGNAFNSWCKRAGKSTLVGSLLHRLGKVTQKTMHKYEKESKAIGKASFSLAWVMDERKAEREHGVTIDIAERYCHVVFDMYGFVHIH
jgi:translation elongation factor EF-1alpha